MAETSNQEGSSSLDTPNSTQVNESLHMEMMDDEFSWAVSLSADPAGGALLSGIDQPAAEDASIPRREIADELRNIRFLATLERPLRIGKHDKQSVFHLCFAFAFHNETLDSSPRIRHVKITVTFDDAPAKANTGDSDSDDSDECAPPPAILAIYPELYEGPVATANMEVSTEVSVSGPKPIELTATHGEKKSWEKEGHLVVHGTIRGSVPHKVVWTINENPITKAGVPRVMKLPLIVRPQNSRRFSARLLLHASYGIRRGLLANKVPILGKNVKPIYFDPQILERMAEQKERGRFDGKVVVEEVGEISKQDLVNSTSFT